MNFEQLATARAQERADYVSVAADRLGLSELIIEKDFWVVWTLKLLFDASERLGPFTFKGGTSLSKGFGAIQRFSEDIDISISRSTLGFPNDEYFYNAPSSKQSKLRVDEVRRNVWTYTRDMLLPELRAAVAARLGHRAGWTLREDEPGSVRFTYPSGTRDSIGYVRPDVLIEFGHADSWPANDVELSPYIADAVGSVTGTARVRVLDPKRTFWEKATLLHEIAFRPEAIPFPARSSRHYYDLTMLLRTAVAEDAIADRDLLTAVARFKSVFFASNRAHYELAKHGTLRLMFPEFRRQAVQKDYADMQAMLFGDIPSFERVCDEISQLEARINSLA